jgi:anti-sigma factor RsiW
MSSNDRHECAWVREHIDEYCDGAEGELTNDEHLRVARHVETCPSCAHELALAQRVGAELRAMAMPAAPAGVIERAEQEVATRRGNVVRLRSRVGIMRWAAVAAGVVLLAAVAWMERQRTAEETATQSAAVERAAQEAALAFAYVNKYARRTGDIVQDEVIERRILEPVEKAMEKSGVSETKPNPDQS